MNEEVELIKMEAEEGMQKGLKHLEAELAKQESLSSETVDWNHVSQISSRILKESSKDLLVLANNI